MACFMKGQIQLCRKKPTHSDSVNDFSETGIIKMIDGFIDNITEILNIDGIDVNNAEKAFVDSVKS
jgi:hypothetical protein